MNVSFYFIYFFLNSQWLSKYVKKIEELKVFGEKVQPNHILINEYLPGQGIMVNIGNKTTSILRIMEKIFLFLSLFLFKSDVHGNFVDIVFLVSSIFSISLR